MKNYIILRIYFFHSFLGMPSTSRGSGTSFLVQTNMEAWVGHPLDPISVLFDTLLEASKAQEECPQNLGMPTLIGKMTCILQNSLNFLHL